MLIKFDTIVFRTSAAAFWTSLACSGDPNAERAYDEELCISRECFIPEGAVDALCSMWTDGRVGDRGRGGLPFAKNVGVGGECELV